MFPASFIFCNLLILTSAKVFLSDLQSNDIEQGSGEQPETVQFSKLDNSENEKLWVLDLNRDGIDSLKLREATQEDVEDFEFYDAPAIAAYKEKQNTVVKKDAPKPAKPEAVNKNKTEGKKSNSKNDIFKYLNKFAQYSKTEADAYLSDSHENDDPSIALYFKGPFTSLIVRLGIREWHYFITPSSSPLFPSWFYEYHSTDRAESLELPKKEKEKFYSALFRLLQMVLRYPL